MAIAQTHIFQSYQEPGLLASRRSSLAMAHVTFVASRCRTSRQSLKTSLTLLDVKLTERPARGLRPPRRIAQGMKMIVSCPSCATRYEMPDQHLGQEGMAIRCRACGYRWVEGRAVQVIDVSPAPLPVRYSESDLRSRTADRGGAARPRGVYRQSPHDPPPNAAPGRVLPQAWSCRSSSLPSIPTWWCGRHRRRHGFTNRPGSRSTSTDSKSAACSRSM